MSSSALRRAAASAAAVVVAVVVLAGCSGQREPTSYTDGVKTDFTSGCWTVLVGDAHPKDITFEPTDNREAREAKATKFGSEAEISAAKDYCGCVIKKITKDVKFSEFKQVNDDLREDNGPLPESFQKAYSSCKLAEA